MSEYFDYDDINLIPKMCIVNSRSECNTKVKLGGFTFNIPVVPANMESVINEDLCIKLASSGYFYIMHRFGVDNVEFVKYMKSLGLYTSISIGVNGDSYPTLEKLLKNNLIPDFITVDIAHGHAIKMKEMLKFLKNNFKNTFVIAGNVSTAEGVMDLEKWGADAVKVGISPGSACTTSPTTGFGSRGSQAYTVNLCSMNSTVPIIADGGIKVPADIAKSVVLGATMCMVGGMLSSHSDSPGRTVEQNGIRYKEFYGSASAKQSNKRNRIEGTVKLNSLKDTTLIEYLEYLEECLQSSISYGGGNRLEDLRLVDWYKK
jgi:GMP reductase